MTPCRRCNSLGFVTLFDTSDLGRVEICPGCKGQKYLPDPEKERACLGICRFCHQEIFFPVHIPCIVGKTHVVSVPNFNAHNGPGEANG